MQYLDDLKKFTAYTSINDINDVNIEPTNVSINLDTFIKKKWKTKKDQLKIL